MKHKSIMEMHPEQRPDEKFLSMGPAALTDAELLETLIVVVPCAIATILNAKTITAIAAKLTALLNNLFIINYLP